MTIFVYDAIHMTSSCLTWRPSGLWAYLKRVGQACPPVKEHLGSRGYRKAACWEILGQFGKLGL